MPSAAVPSTTVDCASFRHPLVQPAPVLSPEDRVLQRQYTDISSQPGLVSTSDFFHPPLQQSRNAAPLTRCDDMPSSDDEDGDLGIAGSRSDSGLGSDQVTRSTPASRYTGFSYPALRQRNSNDDEQNCRATDDSTYLAPPPTLPQSGNTYVEEHQTIFKTSPLASQPDRVGEDGRRRSYRQRAAGNRRTLRPLQVKRHLTGERTDDGEDEYVPARKRRKFTAPILRQRNAQRDARLPRRSRPRAARKQKRWRGDDALSANTEALAYPAITIDKEWPLPDAVLECVRDNGTATFQLQFTWATACEAHGTQDQPVTKCHLSSRLAAREEQSEKQTESILGQPSQPDDPNHDPDVYEAECLLARWRKHTFLVKWSDGTTTWEPRMNILDKRMLDGFEAAYEGFDAGVDVLATRTRAGKCQYLLRWHGRPRKEDSWANEGLLNPKRVERIRESGLDVARA